MGRTTLVFLAWCMIVGAASAEEARPTPEQIQFFEMKVRPLLAERCYRCHGTQKQSNGLRVDSREAILAGGDNGPAVIAGKPDDSPLIRAVRHEGPKMPPKEMMKPDEVAVLVEWVRQGAPWPPSATASATRRGGITDEDRNYWAFRPVVRPTIPGVKQGSWPRSDVDRFVLHALETRGLAPIEDADRRTLIRRVTFDLTGLPPTPDEIDAFLHDDSPDAFARVVERLLASPACGERWGRHWLDVVRYADTAGDNSDYPVPQLYKYRNWVVRAFNEDKPYDQLIREQFAGDLLPAASEEDRFQKIIATGYLANSRRFGSYEDTRYQWYLTYEDTIDNVGRAFLGVTINCTRCHDHKFDPLTSEDYYALYGFFQSTRYPWPGIELDKAPHDLVPLVPAEQAQALMQERQREEAKATANVKRLEKEKNDAEQAVKEALDARAGEDRVKELRARGDDLKKRLDAARKEREKLVRRPLPFETAYAVAEGTRRVGNARMQLRGDPERPGKEVPRRFPTILGGHTVPPDLKGSGRLQLADWLADPKNPLTARVLVNRLWHYHFGKGIVQTPSDFGKQGKPPTHPELLDYLADEFVARGWSIKAMHRLIVLSRTYQLASRDEPRNSAVDPANEYLWKFGRRRLDAESIRDSLLSLAGTLDRSPGGPHPFPEQTTWDFTQHKPFKAVYETNRRSVYVMTQRIQRHPFLALFDGPDTNASTARRITSTTPLQALYLMNDPFVHQQAGTFGARLLAEGADDAARVERAYLLAFGRPPDSEELSASLAFVAAISGKVPREAVWESYARALLATNEFVYVN